jgi:transcriptional regulator with XRE-family HTH domain
MAKYARNKLYPNKATQWSYFMQAIEPNSPEINTAFPEYHPMWVVQSQKKSVSAEYFRFMRELLLNMTHEQCAAYLRVTISHIASWENGKVEVPFMAFELLRVVYESANFRLSNKDWKGWFIDSNGRLVSPNRGSLSFSPDELSFIREVHQVNAMYKEENKQLREEIEPLRAELAAFKAGDQHDGFLDELKEIGSKLAEISARVSPNKVVHISNKTKINETLMEVKAA